MAEASSVAVPPELSELVREASGEPSKHNFARNFQVPAESPLQCGAHLTPSAACPGEARAGSGVLPPGLRAEDGPGAIRFVRSESGIWWCPGVSGPVLAFDIETTGLREADAVTCVCAYDPDRGVHYRESTPSGARSERFLALLDEAPLLCAFNGVRFDLPFLAKRWRIEPQRVGAWVEKLVDPYEACKLALQSTFSLDRLLHANGLESKTGNGAEAVCMARAGQWERLEDYCMKDTVLTHQIIKLKRVRLPGCDKKKKCKLPGQTPC